MPNIDRFFLLPLCDSFFFQIFYLFLFSPDLLASCRKEGEGECEASLLQYVSQMMGQYYKPEARLRIRRQF